MGNVVVGNYPGSIPAPLAKRNCPATGTGSGLTHCFLFGQSRGQRTTTLSALSFFSGPHFSPRQSFPLSFAPFDESCCCGISGGWDLSQGFALGGPGEKGVGGCQRLTFTSSWWVSTVSANPIPNFAKAQPTPSPLTPHRIPCRESLHANPPF